MSIIYKLKLGHEGATDSTFTISKIKDGIVLAIREYLVDSDGWNRCSDLWDIHKQKAKSYKNINALLKSVYKNDIKYPFMTTYYNTTERPIIK